MSGGPSRLAISLRWGLVIVYSTAITVASSFSLPVDASGGVPGGDKVVHAGAFALWSWLFAEALGRSWSRGTRLRVGVASVVATAIFGLSDELHQAFVPGRNADALDLLADSVGGLLGAVVWGRWGRGRARDLLESK